MKLQTRTLIPMNTRTSAYPYEYLIETNTITIGASLSTDTSPTTEMIVPVK